MKAQTHQTDVKELLATKAACCVVSCLLSKLYLSYLNDSMSKREEAETEKIRRKLEESKLLMDIISFSLSVVFLVD